MRHLWYAAVVLTLAASVAGSAEAQETEGYRFTKIEVLYVDEEGGTHGVTTRVFGINQRGDVVGRFRIADTGRQHPFLRTRRGEFRLFFDLLGGLFSGINEDRAIVGRDDGQGLFIDADGAHLIGVLGATETELTGINDAWESVGNLRGIDFAQYPFLRDENGAVRLLDAPGPVSGINNHGEIVGNFPDGQTGFLMAADGIVTPIAVPGVAQTTVSALNTNLEVVGSYVFEPGARLNRVVGFVRDADGRFVRIAVPGARTTIPTGINDEGRVVGYFGRPLSLDPGVAVPSQTDEIRGFLAIPCRVSADRPDCIPVTRIDE